VRQERQGAHDLEFVQRGGLVISLRNDFWVRNDFWDGL